MKNSAQKISTHMFVGNALGAFTLAMGDKVDAAICDATGQSASACYAIVQIGSEPNSSIEMLRRMLGLEHSSVVRLIDRLERSGFAERNRGTSGDRRQVLISLTEKGEEQFSKILDARSKVVGSIMDQLSVGEMKALEGLIGKLMPAVAKPGDDQHIVCRLCDVEICDQKRCPVNLAHDGYEEFPSKAFRRVRDSKLA